MINIWLKNGNFEILRNVEEFKNLVASEMGDDAALQIQKLIDSADYTQQEVQTDLTAYESKLGGFNSMCFEILDNIEKIVDEINNSKRLDRNKILKNIDCIQKIIEHEI